MKKNPSSSSAVPSPRRQTKTPPPHHPSPAETALRESEAKYRRLHESMRDAFVIVDMAGRIQECNQTYSRMLGYTAEELAHLTYVDLTPEKWHAFEADIVTRQIIPQGYSEVYEKEYRKKDGTVFPVELRTVLVKDEAGQPAAMWATVRDITARKQVEAALSASEERFRFLAESIPHMVWSARPDGFTDYYNARFLQYFGKTRQEMEGWTWTSSLHPEDGQRTISGWREACATGRDYHIEHRIQQAVDGQYRWFHTHAVPMRDARGDIIRWYGTSTDVEDHKQAELALHQAREELEQKVLARTAQLAAVAQKLTAEIDLHQQTDQLLRESEERYRAVVEGAGEAIVTVNAAGVLLFMNSTAAEQLGGQPSDFIGKPMGEVYPPETTARQLAEIQHAIRTGQGATADTITHMKDGVRHYLTHIEPLKNAHGQVTAAVVIARDITARRLAELALHESEKKYHRLFDTVSDAIQIIDAQTLQFIEVNHAAEKLYGYSREELLTLRVTDISAEPEATAQSIAELLQAGSTYVVSRKYRKKDGTTYFVEIAACVFETGGRRAACGVVRDITERRRAEEALRESEARFDQLAEQNRTMVWEMDAQGLITYASRVTQTILGYHPDELIGQKYFYDLYAEEHREAHKKMVYAVFERKGQFHNLETAIQSKDGRVVWISTNALPMLNEDNSLRGYRGTNTDITKRKLAEEALQQSEIKFRSLIEHAPDGIVVMKPDKELVYVSPSARRMFGIGPEDPRTIDPDVATHPEDLPRVLAALAELKRDPRQTQTVQYRFRHMDGRWIWIESVFTNLIGLPGIDAMVINFRNIEDHKQAENALKESEARAEALFEDAPLGYHVLDNQGRFTRVNRTELAMLGYTAADMLGRFGWDFLVESDQSREFILACLAGVPPKSLSTERTFRRKDGTLLPVRIESLILRDAGGRVTGIRSNVQDIAARKQAENILARSEKRLREAQRIAHLGYWERDLKTEQAIWSDETYRIFGMPPHEGVQEWPEIKKRIHPTDLEKVEKALLETLREGTPYNVSYRIVRPDGTIRFLQSQGELGRDEAGQPTHILGTVMDITDQIIQAREKEYLASFPTLNPNPVIELDREGHLHYRNPSTDLVFPDLAEKGLQHVWLQTWDQIRRQIWTEHQTQGEREIWLQDRCYEQYFFHMVELDRVRVYGRDITERKQAERAVQDTLAQLQEAQRLAKLGHWTLDVKTRQVTWSEELYRIVGWNPAGPPPGYEEHRALFTPETYNRLDQAVQHASKTGEINGLNLELELVRPDRRHVWIQARCEALRDAGGQVTQLRGTVQDINERVQARQERERYQRKLQAMAGQVLLAEEAERRRLAVDLHDGLGQTLTLVRMKLGMMRQTLQAKGPEEKFREIELLLDEALSTTGTLTFQLSPPVLYELGFVPAVNWLGEEMERRYGLHLQIHNVSQLRPFSNQIGIILFRCMRELLVNVAKHARVKEARVSLDCNTDRLRVVIEDEGVGFEPRSLLEKSTRGGFGLFSIEERMTQLGGKMEVRSSQGRGTTITLTVPLEAAPTAAEEST